jgi:hypothetical protein
LRRIVVLMSDFFEPPPASPPPEPPRYRTPPWFGPPTGTLAGIVAFEEMLAQTDEAAVCISHIAVYPTGFEFDVLVLMDGELEGLDPMTLHPQYRRLQHGSEVPPELLRIGVQFSDGSKATNAGGFRPPARGRPTEPVMSPRGGGGGGGSFRQTHWVWPLPPPGPVGFVCEWPAKAIALTRSQIDAQPILDAATRARVIFTDEHLPEHPGVGGGESPEIVA